MRFPRTDRISLSGKSNRFLPSSRATPKTWHIGFGGSNLVNAMDVTLLPLPLSPTMAKVLPLSRLNEMPRTASLTPSREWKDTFRFRTSNNMKARFTLRISTIQPSVKESRIRARDLGSFIFDDCRMRYGNDPQHRHPRPAVAAFG